jgi:5-methylcytosine-specific restriction protein A
MPQSAPKPCKVCGTLVHDGTSRCAAHKVRDGTFSDRRRGSRHERGYGAEWTKKRDQIMERDGGLCQTCARAGRVTLAYAVDHKVPKFEGGTDDDENLEAICKPDHVIKTAKENQRARKLGLLVR